MHWIGAKPAVPASGSLHCQVKTRYRQPDQACELTETGLTSTRVTFAEPQRAVTPGQFAVFYLDQRCIGSARIDRTGSLTESTQGSREAC
jgi:tRNA-specific 2-thiouridylase